MLTGPALLAAEYAPVRSNDSRAGASDQARHCRFLNRLTWGLGEESLAGATEKIQEYGIFQYGMVCEPLPSGRSADAHMRPSKAPNAKTRVIDRGICFAESTAISGNEKNSGAESPHQS